MVPMTQAILAIPKIRHWKWRRYWRSKNFPNGDFNFHIEGIAQGWQSDIIQILKEHISKV